MNMGEEQCQNIILRDSLQQCRIILVCENYRIRVNELQGSEKSDIRLKKSQWPLLI